METPPRAWGRQKDNVVRSPLKRNTPTSVGKTSDISAWDVSSGNTPTSVGKTLDFTGVDGGLVEIRFVALSVFQSQGACLKFQ